MLTSIPTKLGRRVTAFAISAALATGMTIFVATPNAQAWTRGNVWVMFGDDNCPYGGSVTKIYWGVDGYSSGPPTGDAGDNIIYPTVRVGSNSYNWLSYQVICDAWWRLPYHGSAGQHYIAPKESGVNYWF